MSLKKSVTSIEMVLTAYASIDYKSDGENPHTFVELYLVVL